jgi:inosine/xanthosine triphosphatase
MSNIPFIFAIGSTNPQKVGAAAVVIKKVFPTAHLLASEVQSGVSLQPMGRLETIRGAINRALSARAHLDANWGIGMESGVEKHNNAWYISDYCCLIGNDSFLSISGGTNLQLPISMGSLLQQGEELGNIMDTFSGQSMTKHTGGAASILTKGLLNRQIIFEILLSCAFAPLLMPQIYRNQDSGRKSA